MWNIILLSVRFLDVAKFTTLTPLPLLILCKLYFPTVGLKVSSLGMNVQNNDTTPATS
jgi:hypothetical protein